MAVDTRQKKQSALGQSLPFMMGVSPTGGFALGERQAAGNVYAGILAGVTVTVNMIIMSGETLLVPLLTSGNLSITRITSLNLISD